MNPTERIMRFSTAIEQGNLAEVKKFIGSGVSVNAILETDEKITPLLHAVANEKVSIAEYLISRGARVNSQNADGHTPLMLASMSGNVEMVRILLKAGAKVNLQDIKGYTALMHSMKRLSSYSTVNNNNAARGEIATILVMNGKARTNITNKFGRNAMYYASTNALKSILNLPKKYAAASIITKHALLALYRPSTVQGSIVGRRFRNTMNELTGKPRNRSPGRK